MSLKSKGKVPKLKPDGPRTEGQRQLLELAGSEVDLAVKIGCGSAVIGHWRRGRRIPGEAHRHKIELLFGIPRRAWDVAPGSPIPASKTATTPDPDPDSGDTLTITKAQIEAVLEELKSKSLTDGASAKLRDTLAKLLALRSRLERDQELSEDRVVREHPEWARMKAAILRALEPYPKAAAALLEVLR